MKKKLIKLLGGCTIGEFNSMRSSRDIWKDRYSNAVDEKNKLSHAISLVDNLRDMLSKEQDLNSIYLNEINRLKKELNGK